MRYMLTLVTIIFVTACSESSPVRPDPITDTTAVPPTQELRLPVAEQGGRPLTTTLTGAAEIPGPGDPDGTGAATITLNHGQAEVCFELTAANIAPATAAHIHRAPVGVAGPVVVPLTPPTPASSTGCVAVDQDLVKDIIQNPSAYYVNVHNAPFPAGAIRGQLSK